MNKIFSLNIFYQNVRYIILKNSYQFSMSGFFIKKEELSGEFSSLKDVAFRYPISA